MIVRRAVLAFALAAFATVPAAADPIALRAPVDERIVALTAGAPELSIAWWPRARLGFALEWRLPVSIVGASVGTRFGLLGASRGWGVDLHLAGGVAVPLIEPAAALTGTVAIGGRWRNDNFHVAALAVAPIAVRVFPDPTFRLPVALELWFTVRIKRIHFGGQASAGNSFVPGIAWSSAFQASAFVAWSL